MQTPSRIGRLTKNASVANISMVNDTSLLEESKIGTPQAKRTTLKAAVARGLVKNASEAVLPIQKITTERPGSARPQNPVGLKVPAQKAEPQTPKRPLLTQRPGTVRPLTTTKAVAEPQISSRPVAVARPGTVRPTTTMKPSTKEAPVVAYIALDTGDHEDPIAQAINARNIIGGVQDAVLKEVDAKKAGVQLVKTFKLTALKGLDLLDLIGAKSTTDKLTKPDSDKTTIAAKPVSKVVKPGLTKPQIEEEKKSKPTVQTAKKPEEEKKVTSKIMAKPTIKKQPTSGAESKSITGHPGLQGDISNDTIAQSIRDRLINGGLNEHIAEADIKKNKINIPKQFKLVMKAGKDIIDLSFGGDAAQSSKEETKVEKITKPIAKDIKSVTTAKPTGVKPKVEPKDVATTAASKKVPAAKPAPGVKPKQTTTSGKEGSSTLPPDPNDPIEVSLHARAQNKGEPISVVDAAKKKLLVPKNIKLIMKNETVVDLINDPAKIDVIKKPKEEIKQEEIQVESSNKENSTTQESKLETDPESESQPLLTQITSSQIDTEDSVVDFTTGQEEIQKAIGKLEENFEVKELKIQQTEEVVKSKEGQAIVEIQSQDSQQLLQKEELPKPQRSPVKIPKLELGKILLPEANSDQQLRIFKADDVEEQNITNSLAEQIIEEVKPASVDLEEKDKINNDENAVITEHEELKISEQDDQQSVNAQEVQFDVVDEVFEQNLQEQNISQERVHSETKQEQEPFEQVQDAAQQKVVLGQDLLAQNLQQESEIEVQKVEQDPEDQSIALEQEIKAKKIAQEQELAAERLVQEAELKAQRIAKEHEIEIQRIAKEQELEAQRIAKEMEVEALKIAQEKEEQELARKVEVANQELIAREKETARLAAEEESKRLAQIQAQEAKRLADLVEHQRQIQAELDAIKERAEAEEVAKIEHLSEVVREDENDNEKNESVNQEIDANQEITEEVDEQSVIVDEVEEQKISDIEKSTHQETDIQVNNASGNEQVFNTVIEQETKHQISQEEIVAHEQQIQQTEFTDHEQSKESNHLTQGHNIQGLEQTIEVNHIQNVQEENHAAEVVQIEKATPKQQHPETVEIDVNIVKGVWPFLRPNQAIPNDTQLKQFDLIESLHKELVTKIIQNDAKIQKLTTENPNCATELIKEFELSELTMNSLQIIEEQPIDFSEWVENYAKSQWVARSLKIFLFSLTKMSKIHKQCKWPEIFFISDEQFFKKASQLIESDTDDFDNYLVKTAVESNLDSFSGEQIARIECLLAHIGGITMCDPSDDISDFGICQFMMFVMKDVLKYLGLADERIPSQEYKVCMYKMKLFSEVEAAIKKTIDI